MKRIGHDSEKASLRYLHESPEADQAIADGLDQVIRSAQADDDQDEAPPDAEAS